MSSQISCTTIQLQLTVTFFLLFSCCQPFLTNPPFRHVQWHQHRGIWLNTARPLAIGLLTVRDEPAAAPFTAKRHGKWLNDMVKRRATRASKGELNMRDSLVCYFSAVPQLQPPLENMGLAVCVCVRETDPISFLALFFVLKPPNFYFQSKR